MPRTARVVVPGFPHHITQRGNNKQDVFFTDEDRDFYLDTVKEHGQKYGLRLIGYCLMTNHVRLVAVPDAEEALAKAVGGTHLAMRGMSTACTAGAATSGRIASSRVHSILWRRQPSRTPAAAAGAP